ncbi:unnamed protein product [Heligmosomoides polygyrus]|uniref:SPK domain-containing protein n=1 Tax=Heligmosomoides polygyrus TaxID=6339 RepID=A0A183FTC6_HELPZ|nr:unnamed protein product [Heligmosomoides polygyrus]
MTRQRQSYTRDDEAMMWMYLYEKLRIAHPPASEAKGLKIWEEYIVDCNVERTADSLSTRFRRHMVNNLHRAPLECNVMMYLFRRLRLKLNEDAKRALELKFSIEITRNKDGIVSTFKKVPRQCLANADRLQAGVSAPNQTSSENRVESSGDEGSVTPPPLKRSSLDFTREPILRGVDFTKNFLLDALQRQMEEIKVESRFRARYQRQASNDDSIVVDSSSTQRSAEPQPEPNACEDQISAQEEQIVESARLTESASLFASPPDVNFENVSTSHPAPDPQESHREMEGLTLSSTSDTCQRAFDRLYTLYTHEPCSDVPVESWRDSEEVHILRTELESRISSMLEDLGIDGECAESIMEITFKNEKKIMGRSTCAESYSEFLEALEDCLRYELESLMEFRSGSLVQQPSAVWEPPRSTIAICVLESDASQVPLSLRKQELEDCLSRISLPMSSVRLRSIVTDLERLEGLVALCDPEVLFLFVNWEEKLRF